MTRLVLELQGIGKRFADGHLALDGVDLDVRPGELVSVLGPAGCGKSTLLRIVAGLAGPTSGMVTLGTRRVGLVFSDLLATRSATEAVLLSSRVVVLSPRPGRVVRELAVPLPYPRSPRQLSGAVSPLAAEVGGCLHAGAAQLPAVAPAPAGAAQLRPAGPAPVAAPTPNP